MATQIPEYTSVRETAQAWGVTKRWVNMCIAAGRVPGAVKLGSQWLVPVGAATPLDARRAAKPREDACDLALDFENVLEATTAPWPVNDPDAILATVREERLRLPFEGELAYLRGDFGRVVQCFRQTGGDKAAKLRACALTIAAAVCTGDYPLYLEVEAYLGSVVRANGGNEQLAAFADLCLATAYTGAIAPNMVPAWLKAGNFAALPLKSYPDAAYKHAKYFQCLGRFEAMLGVAQTALSFCSREDQISFHDIYLRVACAIACAGLRRESEAAYWLGDALARALPHGFITPFAESTTAFGGLLERLLERDYPAWLDAVTAQWQRTFANWMAFHNQFTRDNITSMLSLREYEMASLVVHRVPRSQIAAQFHISAGRLNNIMKEIYDKLYVSGREELSQYIL